MRFKMPGISILSGKIKPSYKPLMELSVITGLPTTTTDPSAPFATEANYVAFPSIPLG
jgi:hypothetical protein